MRALLQQPRPHPLGAPRTRPCVWSQRAGLPVPFACKGSSKRSLWRTNATEGGGAATEDRRLKKTIEGLDAILGIEEEPPTTSQKAADKDAPGPVVSISQEALESALKAEAARYAAGNPQAAKGSAELDQISDQMKKILEKAKAMAEEQGTPTSTDGQQQMLRQEFEQLLNVMFAAGSTMDKADMQKLKDSGVFGPMSFWVTEMRQLQEPDKGVLVRGNMRKPHLEVFQALVDKCQELFGDKYTVLLVEDPEVLEGRDADAPLPRASSAAGASSSGAGGAAAAALPPVRVAFQIVPTSSVEVPATGGWKLFVASVLLLLLLACCGQLALVANITKLPKETLEYFSRPDALNTSGDVLPPGLDTWDPSSYLATAAPIWWSLLTVNFSHEAGHRVAAIIRQVKLGPTYFIPNLQIGSFGAVTPLRSLVRSRRDLWDVAAAGPLAGGLASIALLALGLASSQPGALPRELLVPVPTQLFQGSLLLGTLMRLSLGDGVLTAPQALISPLTIAGWCGLLTTSLNLLPVGSLDGGRMVQAAFGRQALQLSSFFTYVGLGLGLLGSSLSLPFGLYVLICQRTAEKLVQDNVTGVSSSKQIATAAAVLAALLILVPMAPELAESVGVGPETASFF